MVFNKKKLLLMLLVFIASFTFIQNNKVEAAINNKPGDIIITNDTSSKGVAGHTGIYISKTTILHTSGWKSEPYPTIISESNWHKRYARSKVIRPNSSTLGNKAANMAVKYFKGKKIPYRVPSTLKNLNSVYCSELVWHSYYKAGKTYKTRESSPPKWVVPTSIYPYEFINSSYVKYNGFKFIDNKW
ncbi:hypothetical protein [Paraliobacillus sp. JSM ZJ581]|uniref:hypothetical protein n=1 Tax=Paraliobacillus sp. JSM ZJ581 TaxID=3342118 RepID=UPI0035A8BECB